MSWRGGKEFPPRWPTPMPTAGAAAPPRVLLRSARALRDAHFGARLAHHIPSSSIRLPPEDGDWSVAPEKREPDTLSERTMRFCVRRVRELGPYAAVLRIVDPRIPSASHHPQIDKWEARARRRSPDATTPVFACAAALIPVPRCGAGSACFATRGPTCSRPPRWQSLNAALSAPTRAGPSSLW